MALTPSLHTNSRVKKIRGFCREGTSSMRNFKELRCAVDTHGVSA
jgi:hypothetical protein